MTVWGIIIAYLRKGYGIFFYSFVHKLNVFKRTVSTSTKKGSRNNMKNIISVYLKEIMLKKY